MTRLISTKAVCDVCRNPRRQVKVYRVGNDVDLTKVDLCREHAIPLDSLIELGVRVSQVAPRAKKWTMEEIEAEKARQAKGKRPPAVNRGA